MLKVRFISHVSLNASLIRFYSLDFLAANGVSVEYWDISALWGHAPLATELGRPYVRRLLSQSELASALDELDRAPSVLISALPYEPRTYRIYRQMSRSGAALGFVQSGVLPSATGLTERRFKDSLFLFAQPKKIVHFLAKRAAFAARALGFVRGFDVVFTAGDVACEEAKAKQIIPINYCDYDDWLETQTSDAPLLPPRYAVYLDQFAPSHPDLKISGIDRLIDAARYYKALNAFFARLETRHDLPVVIAAHPKAHYVENPFCGRRIFSASTRQLTRYCEFAINNSSTSMSYAVLDRKPLVFFTSDDIARHYAPIGLDAFPGICANILGRNCVNIDHPSEGDCSVKPADASLYDDYKYKYLVSRQTEGRLSREFYLKYFSPVSVP